MKVALVHDWLTGMRGGEKCLEVFCELFPDARIYTLLHKKGSVSETIEGMEIQNSFIQHLPMADTKYRSYLPLFPFAIESLYLSGHDLILSSIHCVAKGVKVPKGALHICYCHTPMRYAWLFFDEYFGSLPPIKKRIVSGVIERLKRWDLIKNESVDFFVATSDNVKERIRRLYHRDSDIIFPPVDTARFKTSGVDKGYYLMVSALVPYKRVDIAIEAFNRLDIKLIIIGTGNAESELRRMAGPKVEFLGWRSDEEVEKYYCECRALVFPGEEDFGIVPLEAQACGKPVIAYAKGGALETVIPINKGVGVSNPTGVFFWKQSIQGLMDAVEYFESTIRNFEPAKIREHALKFDRAIFKNNIREYIDKRLKDRTI